MAEAQTPHVVIVPTPGMGHLIPLVELAKRLVHRHNLSIIFVVPTTAPPSKAQISVLESLPSSITHVFLPPIDTSDVSPDSQIETLICLSVARSVGLLRDVVKDLAAKHRLVALVADLFGADAFDVAKEFNISPYIFFPSTATVLSLFLHLPTLDETTSCEFRELEEIQIPGSIPIPGKELLDPVQDRKDDAYKWVLHLSKRYREAEGIMVNSFIDLEGGAVKALQQEEEGKPAVYPVGPLVNMGGTVDKSDQCLKWLDEQPHGSVLFVSFGSGGTLSHDQIIELANGLEISEQRFLWVVRSPNNVANSTYFSAQSMEDPFHYLPNGFVERTKGRGLVVPSWAPQAQILSHRSTSGFLTHAGWNSVLESVVYGVPLIVWPLYAEQRMNAFMLTNDVKVALRPKADENGLIRREEVASVVRGLMEGQKGKEVRNRMKELKEAASTVLSDDGSSTKALSQVARRWIDKNSA